MGFDVKPRELRLIGHGIPHAFGEKVKSPLLAAFADEVDEAMLAGNEEWNIEPIQFSSQEHRNNFSEHLNSLHMRKHELDKSLWENWLYALAMKDILEPLFEVTRKHNISDSFMTDWGERKLKQFLNHIPTRRLDIHLHRQVLRNPGYKSKHSDLEDWAGLGMAMCYCDVVICENHFADLALRDGYTTKARVETSLYELSSTIGKP
jgi:hypothetical protein